MTFPCEDDEAPPEFMPDVQAMRDWQNTAMEAQIAYRRDMLRFSAMLCTCRPWFDRRAEDPPQANCNIHGVLAINPLTGEAI